MKAQILKEEEKRIIQTDRSQMRKERLRLMKIIIISFLSLCV